MHEFLQVQSLVFSLLTRFMPLLLPVVSENIFWSLVELMLLAQVLCLDILMNVVVRAAYNGSLQYARGKLLEVSVLRGLRDHFEHVEKFFLSKVYKLTELLSTYELLVGCNMIDSFSYN